MPPFGVTLCNLSKWHREGRDSPLHILRIAVAIAGSNEHRIEDLRLTIVGELLLCILEARPQGGAGLKIRAGSVGSEHRGFPLVA
jgi:hypothetical protein